MSKWCITYNLPALPAHGWMDGEHIVEGESMTRGGLVSLGASSWLLWISKVKFLLPLYFGGGGGAVEKSTSVAVAGVSPPIVRIYGQNSSNWICYGGIYHSFNFCNRDIPPDPTSRCHPPPTTKPDQWFYPESREMCMHVLTLLSLLSLSCMEMKTRPSNQPTIVSWILLLIKEKIHQI